MSFQQPQKDPKIVFLSSVLHSFFHFLRSAFVVADAVAEVAVAMWRSVVQVVAAWNHVLDVLTRLLALFPRNISGSWCG